MNELSVGDGFKFGCGFFLAASIVWIVMAIIGVLFSLIFGGLLGGLLSEFGDFSQLLLPLLAIV